jgi:glucose-1-phosphate thymidylyltransferase
MLEKGRARRPSTTDGSTIVDPVYIEDGVTLRRSTIGPNVALGAGTVVEDSTLSDTLVGEKAKILRATLRNSLVGDEAVVEGVRGELTIGDHSEVRGA